MAQTINTNIASLNAQRNLTTSQTALATSLQRLSSGLRINSAKDDAAGMAISERFSTQIRGLNQATRNANDGISLAQTGEGALSSVTENLQRIRELAVQSANSTNSAGDRFAINLEVQQRLAEIDRTASQTAFNGTKLLDGSFQSTNFQIGANAGEVINVAVSGNTRLSATGAIATTTSGVLGAGASGGSIAVASGNLLYGTSFSPATASTLSFTPATRLFGAAGALQVDGTSDTKTISDLTFATTASPAVDTSIDVTALTTNFGTAGAAQVDGVSDVFTHSTLSFGTSFSAATAKVTTSDPFTAGDFLASGPLAHFEFTDDTVTGLTISLDGTNWTGNENGMATEITNQLIAAGSNTVASFSGGSIVFTSGELGAGATQPSLANVGGTLTAAGLANFVNSGGVAEVPTTNASFDVDGTTVTLAQNYGNTQAIADDILSQLSGYSAVVVEGSDTIKLVNDGSTVAVGITNADTNADAAGFVDSAGTGGTAAISSTNADFTVDGQAISLITNYADFDALAADLDAQMGAGYTVTNVANAIHFEKDGNTGAALQITGADANATLAGFGDAVGTPGTPEVLSQVATFTVDGEAVVLDANYGTTQLLADAITGQLSGYTATVSGSDITLNKTGSLDAVVIAGADANAVAAGITNSIGVDGIAATGTPGAVGTATFTVGASNVTLAANYADFDAMATAIQSQLLAGSTVTNNNGVFTVSNATLGLASPDVSISASDGVATAAGIGNATDTGGTAATPTTNASFSVNGIAVTLGANYADQDAVAAAIDTQLGAGYTVANAAGTITITNDTMGSDAVVISGADANAIAGGFANATGTDGVDGGSIALANFSINTTSMAGNYANIAALATAINSGISNVYATVVSGALKLTSSADINLGGAEATGLLDFASETAAATVSSTNNLSQADVLTAEAANTMIQRIDSAMNSVSNLRSTFGAIQNRFESVISSLTATSENLTSARSRIQDADFAMETAALTRNQILQQAGIAMLAQANALPNQVLTLLRG